MKDKEENEDGDDWKKIKFCNKVTGSAFRSVTNQSSDSNSETWVKDAEYIEYIKSEWSKSSRCSKDVENGLAETRVLLLFGGEKSTKSGREREQERADEIAENLHEIADCKLNLGASVKRFVFKLLKQRKSYLPALTSHDNDKDAEERLKKRERWTEIERVELDNGIREQDLRSTSKEDRRRQEGERTAE